MGVACTVSGYIDSGLTHASDVFVEVCCLYICGLRIMCFNIM